MGRARRKVLVMQVLGVAVAGAVGCGARSDLPGPPLAAGGAGGAGAGGTGAFGGGVAEGGGGSGGEEPIGCDGGVLACGSDVGACKPGVRPCVDGVFGPCEGAVGPSEEACNGLDDDCDGATDEDYDLGAPCDGPDTDLCLDDVKTCAGCGPGQDDIEVCNGLDDDCDGVVDADCEVGACEPTLVVTQSTPSDPGCVDFPVETGSTGVIEYPCSGGPVTAQLGSVPFTGSVTNGFVSLDGTAIIGPPQTPDGCTWQTDHHIEGIVSQGLLSYSYTETLIGEPPGVTCWQPCTETGMVEIAWLAPP